MSEVPTREQLFEEHTSQQYIALGRFVEAFETVVLTLRLGCQKVLSLESDRQRSMIMVALNHHSLTAKPLLDIFVAMTAELIEDNPEYPNISDIRAILELINREFSPIPMIRNNLLHGTWHVGRSFDPEHIDTVLLDVGKWTTSKNGLKQISLPADVSELNELTERCRKLSSLILNFSVSFPDTASIDWSRGLNDW